MKNFDEKSEDKITLRATAAYALGFLRWALLGVALGAAGGIIGALFSLSIGWAEGFRQGHAWIVWLLPLGGLVIAGLYHLDKLHPTDTNGVLMAIHSPAKISGATAPIIFASTVLTHLLGGSSGREGAALQMGGTLGQLLGDALRLDQRDTTVIVMCGMSAVFSALFGTPVTAAIFAMEVASVGILHFSAIVPCVASALTANRIATAMGAAGESFVLPPAPEFQVGTALAIVTVAIAGAIVSIVYCLCLHQGGKHLARLLPNPFLRIFAGGLAVALLTWAAGSTYYNGAGMGVITAAVGGSARPEAFALKLLFTVLTVASGFKGGEIVPSMFIGSTMGCVLAPLLGLDPSVGAAVGLVSLFCGCLNCPISSILLGVELFSGDYLLIFAISSAVSYMLSADFGLYAEQTVVYSKLQPRFVNRHTL